MGLVRYTCSAQTDLLEAWLFIAEENPTAADQLLDALEHEAKNLADYPLQGRARPELATGLRSWPTSTPYILFYIVQDSIITIVRVLHHARDIEQTAFKNLS